jgi:hypothetical protein
MLVGEQIQNQSSNVLFALKQQPAFSLLLVVAWNSVSRERQEQQEAGFQENTLL